METEYVCLDCEEVFKTPDTWEEDRGEFWGAPCSEHFEACPKCGSLKIRQTKGANAWHSIRIKETKED